MKNDTTDEPNLPLWAAVDAWLVSLAAALAFSAWEASRLSGPEVAFTDAWQASGAASFAIGTVLAPLVFVLGRAARRYGDGEGAAGLVERWRRHAPMIVAATLAGVVAAIAAAIGTASIDQLFGSETVQLVALASLQFGVVFVAAVSLPSVRAMSARAVSRAEETLGRGSSLAVAAIAVVVVAVVATVGLWDILEQMQLRPYVAGPAIGLGALVGLALPRTFGREHMKRATAAVRVIAAAAAAILVALGGSFVLTEPPKSLRLALRQKATTTRAVLDVMAARQVARDFATKPAADAAHTPSCRPDEAPPTLSQPGEAPEDAPDIILVTVDALRWDHTSLSGYARDTTPELADHADGGAVFEAYTPATSTRQTFRSLFTGLYPSQVADPPSTKWGLSFADSQITLAEFLRAAGYATVAVSSEDSIFPRDRAALPGFDVVDESPSEQKLEHGHSAPLKVDRVIAHMSDPELEGPRFVWTHLMEPHQPYPAGPDPVDFGDDDVDEYDAAVKFMDAELDRLIDFARSPTRRESTWLIVTADHGQAFEEHGNRFHGSTVYQEEVHVPLVVWGPGVEPGRRPHPVSLVSLTPTIIDLADLSLPTGLCERSLEAVLRGAQLEPRPIYVEQIPDATRTYFGVAFLRGNHKLILRPTHDVVELYDLAADPDETNDLSGNAELLRPSLQALQEFYRQHGMEPADYGL